MLKRNETQRYRAEKIKTQQPGTITPVFCKEPINP